MIFGEDLKGNPGRWDSTRLHSQYTQAERSGIRGQPSLQSKILKTNIHGWFLAQPGMITAHAFNSITQEVEAGGSL